MAEITITTVGNALGQYCTRYGNMLNQSLKQKLEFEQFLDKVSCDYAYQGVDVVHSRVLQPYKKTFSPNNEATFDGQLNILAYGKIDLSYDWAEIEKFLSKWQCNWFEAGKPEEDWSFPRYMIQEVIMKQFDEDVNLASWAGEFVDPGTDDTPGDYLETWNGFKTHIDAFVSAGDLAPLAIGALGDTTAVEQVKDACSQLPQLYRYERGKIYAAKSVVHKYANDYEQKFPYRNTNVQNPDSMYLTVDKYNKTLIGLDCMEGSDRLVFQFDGKPGMIVGTKTGIPLFPQLRFHVYDRELHVLGEFARFYGWETLKHTFVTDAE